MSISGKSDWTPEAYRLREEFRKRKELTEATDFRAYKSISKNYDVLESEWTLKAYESRERTRQTREAIDLNVKSQLAKKIEVTEKNTDNTNEINNAVNPQQPNESILDRTAAPLKSNDISNERIAHIRFTNQPVTPVIRNHQRHVTPTEELIKKSSLEKSTAPNRPVKISSSTKRKKNPVSDLKKSNGYFRFVSTILLAGTIGFMLGIITFSKSPNTKFYLNGVKSRPVMNK